MTTLAPKSENVLGSSYAKEQYPDKNPVVINVTDINQQEVIGVLTSLKITPKVFFESISDAGSNTMMRKVSFKKGG